MKCKTRNSECDIWHWFDGGSRGVYCTNGRHFWSETIAHKAYVVESEAIHKLMDTEPFPEDAVTEEERERQNQIIMDELLGK